MGYGRGDSFSFDFEPNGNFTICECTPLDWVHCEYLLFPLVANKVSLLNARLIKTTAISCVAVRETGVSRNETLRTITTLW